MNESVQKWLDELTAAPTTAIQKLVLGYSGVSAWSRSSLRESFVEIFQTHAETLDVAVAGWLQERLMKLPPEKTPTLVWASHLQDLFSAVAGLPLTQVARLLRDQMRDFRSWLRPLRTDDGLDPEAAYLSALAWAETNQRLEGMWQGLALLRNHEPVYYTDIGLLGLRKTRDDSGQLPAKAPFLLLATLIDLADTGISQNDWLLTTRAILGGYHYSLETWVREFKPVLEAREKVRNGPAWLKDILPIPNREISAVSPPQTKANNQRGHTYQEIKTMIAGVKQRGPDNCEPKLSDLLTRLRSHASSSTDSYFLIRTFNGLAEAARKHNPKWAVALAEESLEWNRTNSLTWNVLAHCLWSRGLRSQTGDNNNVANADCREAIDILWQARFCFPTDAHIRTELAKLLRMANDLDAAEMVCREAIAEFPSNPWCYNGLADLLVFRWASSDDLPTEEIRSLYQHAASLGDEYARDRLNNLRRHELRRFESQLFPKVSNAQSQKTDYSEIANFASPSISEMRPAQRLGRAILIQWQARKIVSAIERERLFAEAEALLNLPEELTGECRTAFLEARGFLLLARNRTTEARTYFEQQLAATAPRRPLGLRLGFAEARARLGETLSDNEEAELSSFGPEGSILPLVLKVIRLLESTASDAVLRDLLLALYPRVRELAGMPASELGEEDVPAEPTAPACQPETPDTMMAQLLLASVFRPAAINTPADLQAADSIPRVRASLKSHRDDIFSVAEKLALAN